MDAYPVWVSLLVIVFCIADQYFILFIINVKRRVTSLKVMSYTLIRKN